VTARLRCAGLTGGRGASTAFRDVDLDVDAGKITALLGPNGAGKTTLLLTIAGLLTTKTGTVEVDGEVLANGRPAKANEAGVVLLPDNRSLFTNLSVEENLRVARRRGGPTPKDMLEVFPGLERRWTIKAGALSGGEQQMLAMARALIQQPKVLLADELSLGLAPLIVQDLFGAVRRMADEHGCAVLLVEQHVHLALRVADDAAVLNHGSIVLRDSAERLQREEAVLEEAYLGAVEESAPGGLRPVSRP
jgi:branched-chain amino acid transport system ATP-binding protein